MTECVAPRLVPAAFGFHEVELHRLSFGRVSGGRRQASRRSWLDTTTGADWYLHETVQPGIPLGRVIDKILTLRRPSCAKLDRRGTFKMEMSRSMDQAAHVGSSLKVKSVVLFPERIKQAIEDTPISPSC